MSFFLILYIYLLIGTGFAIAAHESDLVHKWKWWELLTFIIIWPCVVAYAIGKMPVGKN